ncbi:MAG: hypothetical protein WCC01_08615 [Acidimicrobiia bacterium]
MGRLRRFENNRFVGTRDDMTIYDCDDTGDFIALESRMEDRDLVGAQLLQAFGPDTVAEAMNRGFSSR